MDPKNQAHILQPFNHFVFLIFLECFGLSQESDMHNAYNGHIAFFNNLVAIHVSHINFQNVGNYFPYASRRGHLDDGIRSSLFGSLFICQFYG